MNEVIDKIILGYCFQNKIFLTKVLSSINNDYFVTEYKKIANASLGYYKKYKKILTWNVLEHFLKQKKAPLDKVLYYEKMYNDITNQKLNDNDFEFYFEEFRKRHWGKLLEDSLIGKGTGAVDILVDQKNPLAAWEKIKKAGLVIETSRQSEDVKRGDIKDSVQQRLEKYEYNKENPEEAYGLKTGFVALDEATKGLKGGEVLVIAGRPGSGKSISAMVIGKNAFKAGKNVLLISIEMPKEQYELRFDSSYSGLELDKIEMGKLNDAEEEKYKQCLKDINERENLFYIVDTPRCTPLTVEAELEFLIQSFEIKIDLVIIDYIGIMKADESQKNDNEEQARVIEGVRSIARRYSIPFVVPVQLNRDMTKHRKGTERLSRSDVIGQTADVVVQIAEPEQEDEVSKLDSNIEYHLVKNRKGKSGSPFSMYYNPATMTVEDRDLTNIIEDLGELE